MNIIKMPRFCSYGTFLFLLMFCSYTSVFSYNPEDAIQYAEQYWETPNHLCGTYSSCTPWSYWGSEYCGYGSHGGDCANFVSQCIIAGGHDSLNENIESICRGYPCGSEEIGADKLQQCLKEYHGWVDLGIGYLKEMPTGIKAGDVLLYSRKDGYGTHATLVVRVAGKDAYIAAHSSGQFDRIYTYLQDSSHAWYRWLHNPLNDAVSSIKSNTDISAKSIEMSFGKDGLLKLYDLKGRAAGTIDASLLSVNGSALNNHTAKSQKLSNGVYFAQTLSKNSKPIFFQIR